MRIALLTVHHAPNCGAMLQAWALMHTLRKMGHEVEFPDCNHIDYRGRAKPFLPEPGLPFGKRLRHTVKNALRNFRARGIFLPTMARFEEFVRRNMPESALQPQDFASRYDTVVVGSDQLWNGRIMGDDMDLFLGVGIPSNIPLVSYGTSFGDTPPEGPAADRVLRALPRFAALSVRESRGARFLEEAGFRAQVVPDPTLLLTADEYRPISTSVHPDEPYLYAYSLFFDRRLLRLTVSEAKRRGLRPVYTPLSQYTRYGMPRGIEYGVTPDRFVDYVANAACVLTDSFHGTVFSLLFRKPFVSFCRAADPTRSRHGELLRLLGCLDRQIAPDASEKTVRSILDTPVSPAVGERIASVAATGRAWLTDHLDFSRPG